MIIKMEKIKKYRNCEIVNISFGGLEPIKFEDLLKIRGGEECQILSELTSKSILVEQYKAHFQSIDKTKK